MSRTCLMSTLACLVLFMQGWGTGHAHGPYTTPHFHLDDLLPQFFGYDHEDDRPADEDHDDDAVYVSVSWLTVHIDRVALDDAAIGLIDFPVFAGPSMLRRTRVPDRWRPPPDGPIYLHTLSLRL